MIRLTGILLLFFWFPKNLGAQIKNIVFEGAGMRGIAYAGAIRQLEQKGLLKEVQRVGGTSAGALTALLVSLGYTSQEITGVIEGTSFKKFNQGRFFFLGGVHRMHKYYGWYRSEKLDEWIGGLIQAKTGVAHISFSELCQRGYKDLYVTGTCLNRQRAVVFSYESYPDMAVKDAVRISMSIPLYFEAVFLDATGQVVHRPRRTDGLDVLVDGGFTANFPIRLFDSTKYTDALQPNAFRVNPETLGFRIDSEEQIASDQNNGQLAPLAVTSLKSYMAAFYTMILENLNRQALTGEDWARTVSISDGGLGPRIRKLTKEEVRRLTEEGRAAASRYFESTK